MVNFFIVRCFYPRLLTHGETAADRDALRALHRRCTRYLAVAVAIPLVGVISSLMFLDTAEVALVLLPIYGLCIVGVLGFLGDYWLFRQTEADLLAFERAVS
nr:hypothetical protein [Nocardia tengchongensis]